MKQCRRVSYEQFEARELGTIPAFQASELGTIVGECDRNEYSIVGE